MIEKITYSDFGNELRFASRKILTRLDSLPNSSKDSLPIRSTVHRASAKQSQGVIVSSCIVDGNIPQHVFADLLSQVNIDAQKVGWTKTIRKQIHIKSNALTIGLRGFYFLEQALEPSERRSIATNPEELYAAERTEISSALTIPNMLQNRGERSNT